MLANCITIWSFTLITGIRASVIPSSSTRLEKGSFLAPRTLNPDFEGHHGPHELARVYRKYRIPATHDEEPGNESTKRKRCFKQRLRDGTGLVEANPVRGGVKYISSIVIGGQTIDVDFDTGSADLWVFGPDLDANMTSGHQIYDPSQSGTFVKLAENSFDVLYGDGSGASGGVGTDVVDVGGVIVNNQAVGVATAVSEKLASDASSNGFLGLAFSSNNRVSPDKQKTFFDNVMDDLAEPLFTADLRRGEPGAYEFGRIDRSKYTGEMAWIPVNTTDGFWQFTSDKFAVGDGPDQPTRTTNQAIADTGTTLILGDPAMVEAYYAQVPGAEESTRHGGFIFPCSSQLPDLSLDIGGLYTAHVDREDLKFSQISDTSE